MMMGQSAPATEMSLKDPIWHINPLILRQSAIFADIISPKSLNVWIEQGGTSQWTDIDVADIEVARFDE